MERRRARQPAEQDRLLLDRGAYGRRRGHRRHAGRDSFREPGGGGALWTPDRLARRNSTGPPAIAGDVAEVEVVRQGGGVVNVELRIVDTDWDGERARLASLRDITDRKRAQEHAIQLERERSARAEAEAASRAKSDFLATMSHELRTPLNAIIGYSELLDMEIAGALSESQRHHIDRIRRSGRHLLGLVNEVLDLAKVEAGQLTLEIGHGQVHRTVEGALAVIQQLAESQGIQLEWRYHCAEDAVYHGDENRVRQILVNLLNNAVKFTPAGGQIILECGITTQPAGAPRLRTGEHWMHFRITDTGVGIPTDQVAVIFDPFVQVASGRTRPKDGWGWG